MKLDLTDYRELRPEHYDKCLTPALAKLLKRLKDSGILFTSYWSYAICRKDVIAIRLHLITYKEDGDEMCQEIKEVEFVLLDAGMNDLSEESFETASIVEVDDKTHSIVYARYCCFYYNIDGLAPKIYLITSCGHQYHHKIYAVFGVKNMINALLSSKHEAIAYLDQKTEEQKMLQRRDIKALESELARIDR